MKLVRYIPQLETSKYLSRMFSLNKYSYFAIITPINPLRHRIYMTLKDETFTTTTV